MKDMYEVIQYEGHAIYAKGGRPQQTYSFFASLVLLPIALQFFQRRHVSLTPSVRLIQHCRRTRAWTPSRGAWAMVPQDLTVMNEREREYL